MNDFLLNISKFYINILDADCSVLGTDLQELLDEAFLAIRICVPILCVILIAIDVLSAVTSGDEKNMKDAQSKAVKRLIIGVVIFFIPTFVNLLLEWAGFAFGTCGIG